MFSVSMFSVSSHTASYPGPGGRWPVPGRGGAAAPAPHHLRVRPPARSSAFEFVENGTAPDDCRCRCLPVPQTSGSEPRVHGISAGITRGIHRDRVPADDSSRPPGPGQHGRGLGGRTVVDPVHPRPVPDAYRRIRGRRDGAVPQMALPHGPAVRRTVSAHPAACPSGCATIRSARRFAASSPRIPWRAPAPAAVRKPPPARSDRQRVSLSMSSCPPTETTRRTGFLVCPP